MGRGDAQFRSAATHAGFAARMPRPGQQPLGTHTVHRKSPTPAQSHRGTARLATRQRPQPVLAVPRQHRASAFRPLLHRPDPGTVASSIARALPWTLVLVGVTTVVAFLVGTLLGVYAGWRRGRKVDSTVTLSATLFAAFPPFWLGLLLLYVFSTSSTGSRSRAATARGSRPTSVCPSSVTPRSTACYPHSPWP